MDFAVGTCPICEQPIRMTNPHQVDMGAWHQRPGALMDEHLRTHPEPLRARLWLRRFLEDLLPRERAEAAKRIYSRLRQVWGDQDCHGVYTMDEVLASAHLYRLWVDTHRCSYAGCAVPQASLCRVEVATARMSVGLGSLRRCESGLELGALLGLVDGHLQQAVAFPALTVPREQGLSARSSVRCSENANRGSKVWPGKPCQGIGAGDVRATTPPQGAERYRGSGNRTTTRFPNSLRAALEPGLRLPLPAAPQSPHR